MAKSTALPFLNRCSFCKQGLIRVVRCPSCAAVAAICDECEAIWKRPKAVQKDPSMASDGQHPDCPHCNKEVARWDFLSQRELKEEGLDQLTQGNSE